MLAVPGMLSRLPRGLSAPAPRPARLPMCPDSMRAPAKVAFPSRRKRSRGGARTAVELHRLAWIERRRQRARPGQGIGAGIHLAQKRSPLHGTTRGSAAWSNRTPDERRLPGEHPRHWVDRLHPMPVRHRRRTRLGELHQCDPWGNPFTVFTAEDRRLDGCVPVVWPVAVCCTVTSDSRREALDVQHHRGRAIGRLNGAGIAAGADRWSSDANGVHPLPAILKNALAE